MLKITNNVKGNVKKGVKKQLPLSKRMSTILDCPFADATWRAVLPAGVVALRLAPINTTHCYQQEYYLEHKCTGYLLVQQSLLVRFWKS